MVAFGALCCDGILAQSTSGRPAFEVASVKVNTTGERPSADGKGDRLTLRNVPMRVIVALAYQVPNDRISGPAWIDSDGYDIVAKPEPGSTREDLWPMIQTLLAERFKLSVHREQKPTPAYALVVGKNGPKLKNSSPDSTVQSTCSRQGMKLTCVNQRSTIGQLAQNLPRWLPRDWLGLPVVDQTGLDGAYDFSLTWTMTDRSPSAEAADPAGMDLFEAIQEQLGLKLEERKVLLDRIVIDHVERVPSAN
jgi:uncharacterized protein (TIGR03435 family)